MIYSDLLVKMSSKIRRFLSVSLPTSPTENVMVKSVEDFVPDNEGLDSSFLDDGKDVKMSSKPSELGETTDRYIHPYLLLL